MHFYSKSHFSCIFIVKIISQAFLLQKSFPMHFYSKIIANAFYNKIISIAFL